MILEVLSLLLASVGVLFVLKNYVFYVSPQNYYPNKVVILTGASQGIGADLAVHLSQLRAKLVLAARNEKNLQDTAKLCPNEVLIVPTDVSNEDQCKNLIDKTIQKFGKIDIIILNAAKSVVVPFEQCTDAFTIQKDTININLMQCVYLSKFSLPHLKQTKGIIVAVSSVAGVLGSYGSSAYSASKHAIHGFFKSLRIELGNAGVSIVILPLPFVRTEVASGNLLPKDPNFGMHPKDCAKQMADCIPQRPSMYFLTWETWFGVQLAKVAPGFVESLSKGYLDKNFRVTSLTKQQ